MSDLAREQIKQFLSNWTNSTDNPKFAVLIEGGWGCGKTHFIQNLVNGPDFTERKTIYLSLFGVSNLQDFERQLFYAASSKATKIVHQGLGFASSLFSGAIGVSSGGLFSGSVDINKAVQSTIAQVTEATNVINDALVIIDDLERCGFDQSELLGVLNRYIEHGNARVILVANTSRIKDTKFKEFREKVVGQSFEIPPDPKAAVATFVAEMSETKAKQVIVERTDSIEELYRLSQFNNLRAVRQFLWFLSGIIEAAEEQYQNNRELMDSLTMQAFIFFMEFKLNLGGPESSLSPSDLVEENQIVDDGDRHFRAYKLDVSEPDSPKQKVIQKYNLNIGLLTAVTLRQWIDILESGVVDSQRFNNDLAGAPEEHQSARWPSWRRLWHIWNWDFSDGSFVDFEADLKDILIGIEEGRYKNPLELMHVVGVILLLLDEKLIEDVEDGWVQRLKAYIDDVVIPDLNLGCYHALHQRIGDYDQGLQYARADENDFREVRQHLEDAISNWYSDWKENSLAEHLIQTLKTNYSAFFGDLTVAHGEGMQRFVREPVLQRLEPAVFVETWLSLGRKDERSLTHYFRDRYVRDLELISEEGPWWENVAHYLSVKTNEEKVMPRKAQLRSLEKGIASLLDESWRNREKLEKGHPRSLLGETLDPAGDPGRMGRKPN